MSIINVLHKIERAIVSYADEAGKDIKTIGEEILEFIEGKKADAVKAPNDEKAPDPDTGTTGTGTTGSGTTGSGTTGAAA